MRYDRDTIKPWAGNSQWRACRADLARYRSKGYTGWGTEAFWALAVFRLQKIVRQWRPRWFWFFARLALAVTKKFITIVTLIDLHPDAEIGPGMVICHGGPVRIHGDTKLGADCAIHGVCTIGAGPRPGGAVIGDHVIIGCHASIIGSVNIGDDASVAANSLVINDVPAGCVAIGVPAKILPLVFRINSSPTTAPSVQPEMQTLGLLPHHHSQIANPGEVSAPNEFALVSADDPEAKASTLNTDAVGRASAVSDGSELVASRRKSKTPSKRRRSRQLAAIQTNITPSNEPSTHGLAINVAKCLKRSGHIDRLSHATADLHASYFSHGLSASSSNGDNSST